MSTVSEQLRINVPQPSLCHQVFVGPPYNSFPLPGDVEYAASSIVFNITTYQSWMNKTMLWELPTAPEGHALSSTDAWFWMPDTPVDHVALELETAGSIVATLRRVTAAEIDQRLAAVEEQRRFFMFTERLTRSVSATNSIISSICRNYDSSAPDMARGMPVLGLQHLPPKLGVLNPPIPQACHMVQAPMQAWKGQTAASHMCVPFTTRRNSSITIARTTNANPPIIKQAMMAAGGLE